MPDRRLLLPLVAVIIATVGLAISHADGAKRPFEHSNGVPPITPAVHLTRGQQACQAGIALSEPVHRVQFVGLTTGGPVPPLDVRVLQERTGKVLARAPAPAGPAEHWIYSVPVPTISDAEPIDVCVTNRGHHPVDFLGVPLNSEGGPWEAVGPPQQRLTLDGRELPGDITMDFPRERPRSLLSLLPRAVGRVAQYRVPGFGPWAPWLLLVLALTVAPVVLLRAGSAALRDDRRED